MYEKEFFFACSGLARRCLDCYLWVWKTGSPEPFLAEPVTMDVGKKTVNQALGWLLRLRNSKTNTRQTRRCPKVSRLGVRTSSRSWYDAADERESVQLSWVVSSRTTCLWGTYARVVRALTRRVHKTSHLFSDPNLQFFNLPHFCVVWFQNIWKQISSFDQIYIKLAPLASEASQKTLFLSHLFLRTAPNP